MALPSPLPADPMTFASSAGNVSYYADIHQDGRPVLLLHSINAAAGAYEMRPLFEHYRTVRPTYALDLPGFGLSDRDDIVYSPELYAEVITEFLQATMTGPVDIIALSLSCEFTAMVAVNHPERVNTLTFLAPSGMTDRPSLSKGFYDTISFPLWGKGLFNLLVVRPSIRFFLNLVFVEDIPEDYLKYAYDTTQQPGAHHAPLYFVGGQLFMRDVRERFYNKVPVPVLVIYGDDPNVGFAKLPDLEAENPNFESVRFLNSNSMPHWDEHDATVNQINQFWDKFAVAT